MFPKRWQLLWLQVPKSYKQTYKVTLTNRISNAHIGLKGTDKQSSTHHTVIPCCPV